MIRIVQVGMGSWGRDWALKVLPQVPGAELVGCADSSPAALCEAGATGIVPAERRFASLGAALARVEADAVLVTTDLPSHVATVTAALEAGKHVLVEKPFAPSLTEGRETVELAERVGRTLMVSQNYRFFPAVRAVRALLEGGTLGRLLHVDIEFFRHSPSRADDRQGHRSWREPLLLDMAIHHFDLLRLVTRREPVAVDCRSWNPSGSGFEDPPEATAVIDLDDGTSVSYRGSWLCRDRRTPWAGEWRMELEGGELWWTSRDDRQSTAEDAVFVSDRNGSRSPLILPQLSLLDRAGALDAFVRAVQEGTEPECSARDNLASLALAHAAVESARRREPVTIERGASR